MKGLAITLLLFTLATAACGQRSVDESAGAAAQIPSVTAAPNTAAAVTGVAARGAELFRTSPGTEADEQAIPACSSCHATSQRQILRGSVVAPSFVGLSQRAGTRVSGLSAEEYLRQSILQPSNYVLEGFNDAMYTRYGDILTEQDIADLIAYLLTL